MYVKKIKRKCGVRGCKNTVSYAISKSREMGNSIIACKECLLEALAVIEEQNKPVTENFPEAEAVDETVSDASAEEEAPTETEKPKTRQRKK
jgi:hypothetical protein